MEEEYLATLTKISTARGSFLIEKVGNELRIRRKSKPTHPRTKSIGLNHSLLSDRRLSGKEYSGIERCRRELLGWRTYYLDPRVSMRRAARAMEVDDIGALGENIAPFLSRLKSEENRNYRTIL